MHRAHVRQTHGKDSSLAYYMGLFQVHTIMCMNSRYSPHAKDAMTKCRALLKAMSIVPLAYNAPKCIFVRCDVVLGTFRQRVTGRILAATAIGAAINVTDPWQLARTFAQPKIMATRWRANALKAIEAAKDKVLWLNIQFQLYMVFHTSCNTQPYIIQLGKFCYLPWSPNW